MPDTSDGLQLLAGGVARPRRKPDLSSALLAGKLTEEATAAALGKSIRTIRRWRGQGLPSEGRGSLVLFDIDQVRAWLAGKKRGGLAAPRRRARNQSP